MIQINLNTFISNFGLSADAVDLLKEDILMKVTSDYLSNYYNEIDRNLNSTRNQYKANVNIVSQGRFKNSIILTGDLPNMIEQGASAFDMKQGFMNSPNVKYTSKNNIKYLTIPLRLGSPNALGENPAFANALPETVYRMAQKLDQSVSQYGRKVSYGSSIRQRDLTGSDADRNVRNQINERGAGLSQEQKMEYVSRTSIYAGLTRTSKTYEKSTQSKFMTFRRVTENSPINSWIHKGFSPYNLMGKANDRLEQSIQPIVQKSVDNFLRKVGL